MHLPGRRHDSGRRQGAALILDIGGIASHCQLTIPADDAAANESAKGVTEETQPLLLFSNHPSEHFGLPMELVARLERVPADQIDSVGGQQVLQYRGGTLPLLSLEQCIGCKPRCETTRLYVAVFVAAEREVGLIVPDLSDIRPVSTRIDTVTFREPGIAGSLVYERMTVRLVDLHELTRKIHPDWYDSRPAPKTPEDSAPRILVAEDSDFFRKQLTGFFQSEGYEVQGAEDGRRGLESAAGAGESLRPGGHRHRDAEHDRPGTCPANPRRRAPGRTTGDRGNFPGRGRRHPAGTASGSQRIPYQAGPRAAHGLRDQVAQSVRKQDSCKEHFMTAMLAAQTDELEIATFYVDNAWMGVFDRPG